MEKLLDRADLNGLDQVVLDELAGAYVKGAVRNAPAYLRELLERVARGSFVPEKALAVAAARERALPRAAPPFRRDPVAQAEGERFLARLRKKGKA